MKLVANVKDRLVNSLKPLVIFYGFYLFFALLTPFIVSMLIAHENVVGSPTGVIFPSFIYAAIIGMLMVTLRFNNSIQFGSSRKTIFISYQINSIVVSLILAILNIVFTEIMNNISWLNMTSSVIDNLYKVNNVSFEILVFSFVLFLLSISIGSLSGLLFKRLKKITLMFLGAALVFIPMVLGYIFSVLPQSAKLAVFDFFGTILGLQGKNIWAPVLTLLVICLIFNFISWLVIRRQPVK
ncbi:hypothetical protein Q2T76_06425 [Lactobacillus sp. YT155]|uniref:hypothetical protein n=1 Tax=Lactobacillus sp. YT155 TaxID=3060955 RepID=UPI00265DC50F|nr:hypothetical protein [Lactobacillus sp. YT155]MDO1605692.1 hypothetical protein [Lactobacillus sp. YT155]